MKRYSKSVFTLLVLIFFYSLCFAQGPGDLLWKSSTGWFVHAVAPTGDVNGDGIPDIFAGSGDNLIYCFSGGGATKGNIIWSYTAGEDVWTVASLEDVNGDGVNDCLAGAGDNKVYCISGGWTAGSDSLLWSYSVNGDVWSVAPIRDVDGDGINDCLAGTGDNKVLCLSGVDGRLIWSFTAKSDILTVHAIQDVDGDGKDDCLAGGHGDRVLCISGGSSGTGKLIWYYDMGTSIFSVMPIGDVTGDGIADCLAGGMDEKIYCISGGNSGAASLHWTYSTDAWVKTVSPISDVDGDGVPDCLAGGLDNKVYCVSGSSGQLVWSYLTGSTILSVASISDVNGTGGEDCIAGGEDNKVYCIEGKSSGRGEVLWSYKIAGSVKCVAPISDLDGNGVDDVVSGSDDSYIYVLEGGETIAETVSTPSIPTGPSSGKVGQVLSFSTGGSVSNLGHTVEYRFDWGEGSYSSWGDSSRSHSYQNVGVYSLKAQARCKADTNVVSSWSSGKSITVIGHSLNISVSPSDAGSVTKNPNKSEYNNNEDVKLTAASSTGYVFDHWGGALTGNANPVTIVMDDDKSVTAYFKITPETITTPSTPTGPSNGEVGQSLTFSTGGSVSNLGHTVEYRFDWGDGNYSSWGDSSRNYSWSSAGTFIVKAQARCVTDTSVVSNWSEGATVAITQTGIYADNDKIPSSFRLFQNHPNPFNGWTLFNFELPRSCQLRLEVFNVSGELVAQLARGQFSAGRYQIRWDGKTISGQPLPSGLYIYRLTAGEFTSVKMMMLIK